MGYRSSTFAACVIVFLDISLRPAIESSSTFDDITDVVPRCVDALKSSLRIDHRVCKRYLETLIPFWITLKPPPASEVLPGQKLSPDLSSSAGWMTLDSSWTNTWTHGHAYAITDELLTILKEPCGGIDHKDWEARSWDWRFLLPSDPSSTAQGMVSTTNSTNSPWIDPSHKKKVKRSKGDEEASNHSQSSRYSSPGPRRLPET